MSYIITKPTRVRILQVSVIKWRYLIKNGHGDIFERTEVWESGASTFLGFAERRVGNITHTQYASQETPQSVETTLATVLDFSRISEDKSHRVTDVEVWVEGQKIARNVHQNPCTTFSGVDHE